MSAAGQAARLRAQADALEREAGLEDALASAKDAYRDNLDDPAAKKRFQKARDALVGARQARRPAGPTIGGDAVRSDPEEG